MNSETPARLPRGVVARLVVGAVVGIAAGSLGWSEADDWWDPPRVISLMALAALIAIRVWYVLRLTGVEVKKRYTRRDVPQWLAQIGLILPILWVVSPVLRFADYPSRPSLLVAGTLFYACGLWICYRSHADLGPGLSPTLEIKEDHQLVTHGIYRRIRHPMYLGLSAYGLGQAMVVPNLVAGPSGVIGMLLLVALRVGHEEQMMLDEFGDEYATYCERTNRLLPGIW